MTRGNVAEIFDSIQGEGPLLGCRQVFVRLGGCNLACSYCDTREAIEPAVLCRTQSSPGCQRYDRLENPLSVSQVVGAVERLLIPGHHSVTVTGGEPLIQPDFVGALLQAITSRGHRVYLETNGICHGELSGLLQYLQWVATDIKLSSCTGEANRFEDNLEFLKKCDNVELFVKFVVTRQVDPGEFLEGIELVKRSGKTPIAVIQPVTSMKGEANIGPDLLLELQHRASEVLPDVRVIPRIHQILSLA